MTEEEKVRKINPYSQIAILNATIIDLEKRNAQLNRDKTELVNSVTELTNKVTELEKENAKLREYAKFLQDTYCGIDRELAELKEKIEKMKCCENCKKQLKNVVCVRCKNNSEWELAE